MNPRAQRGWAAWALLVTAAAVSACASANERDRSATLVEQPPTLAAPTRPPDGSRAGRAMASRPDLRVAVSGPSTATYVPGAAGPGGQHVRVRVTNAGTRPGDVSKARVGFAATRDGVPFPCRHHVDGGVRDPEPRWLEPGQSFTFERDIDCALTTLGRYDIGVYVSFGRDDYDHGERVGEISLDVVGAGPSVPHPYPGMPALHVGLIGEGEAHPLTVEQWRRGDYHVMAVFVNAGRAPIALGTVDAALDVAPRSASCPREHARVEVHTSLAPGEARIFPIPLRCPLEAGHAYDVTGFLALGGASAPVEVGRMHVRVRPDSETPLPVDRPPGTIQIGEGP